jgi:hypothetical protein
LDPVLPPLLDAPAPPAPPPELDEELLVELDEELLVELDEELLVELVLTPHGAAQLPARQSPSATKFASLPQVGGGVALRHAVQLVSVEQAWASEQHEASRHVVHAAMLLVSPQPVPPPLEELLLLPAPHGVAQCCWRHCTRAPAAGSVVQPELAHAGQFGSLAHACASEQHEVSMQSSQLGSMVVRPQLAGVSPPGDPPVVSSSR